VTCGRAWTPRAGADAHAEAAVARCLTGHAFRNFFALARDEFDALARPDWRPLTRLGAPRAGGLRRGCG